MNAIEAPYDGPVLELAYAAGMFEGEGTVTITRGGDKGYVKGLVTLTSVDRETVDFFHHRWGGHVRVRQPGGNARPAWVWAVSGDRMYRFLFQVNPHLRRSIVKEKFDIAMQCHRARRRGARQQGYAELMDSFRRQIRALNHRGTLPMQD